LAAQQNVPATEQNLSTTAGGAAPEAAQNVTAAAPVMHDVAHDVVHDVEHGVEPDVPGDVAHDVVHDVVHDLVHEVPHEVPHDVDHDVPDARTVAPNNGEEPGTSSRKRSMANGAVFPDDGEESGTSGMRNTENEEKTIKR
jgi:hypothetical protein